MIDSSFNRIYIPSGGNKLTEVGSISNFSISKNIAYENPYVLGGMISAIQTTFPTPTEISFDRTFMESDFLFQYTGKNPLTSLLLSNGNFFNKLNSLYLTSYTASFSVGELPKINTKFLSFDSSELNFVSDASIQDIVQLNYDSLVIPKLNNIYIIPSDANSQAVETNTNIYSFDYSLNIKRQPYYTIGKKDPNEVCEILPIEISFSINSKISNDQDLLEDNSQLKELANNLNFTINVSGIDASSNLKFLFSYPITNARLVGKEKQIQSSNTLEVRKKYIGYYGL